MNDLSIRVKRFLEAWSPDSPMDNLDSEICDQLMSTELAAEISSIGGDFVDNKAVVDEANVLINELLDLFPGRDDIKGFLLIPEPQPCSHKLELKIELLKDKFNLIIQDPQTMSSQSYLFPYIDGEHEDLAHILGDQVNAWINMWKEESV